MNVLVDEFILSVVHLCPTSNLPLYFMWRVSTEVAGRARLRFDHMFIAWKNYPLWFGDGAVELVHYRMNSELELV